MDRQEVELSSIAGLYGENLRRHGKTPLALGWKSGVEQRLRFEMLTEFLEPGDGLELIDYGCGFGDLANFLIDQCSVRITNYAGYEISLDLADVARGNLISLGIPGSIISNSKVTTEADWCFVSGTFNVALSNDKTGWKESVLETIASLFDCARVGLSFNLLSSYVDWKSDELFYGNPSEFFDFCKTNLSPKVILNHRYPLYEWTITVLR